MAYKNSFQVALTLKVQLLMNRYKTKRISREKHTHHDLYPFLSLLKWTERLCNRLMFTLNAETLTLLLKLSLEHPSLSAFLYRLVHAFLHHGIRNILFVINMNLEMVSNYLHSIRCKYDHSCFKIRLQATLLHTVICMKNIISHVWVYWNYWKQAKWANGCTK